MAGAILAIGIIVFLAHLFVAVFNRTRIPDVLLLMAVGLMLGPGLHLINPLDFGKFGTIMSTLALVVILFESGITITPESMRKAIRPALGLTIPTFLVTALTAYLVALYGLQLSPTMSAMAGAILGGVSAAVAIPLVKSVGIREPLSTALILESALGDVISIVLLLGLMQAAASGQMVPVRMLGNVVSSLTMAAVIGLLGGVGWLLVLDKVRQFPNTAFTTLAVVFILYGVADELGFSGAITALAFGATLTNHRSLAGTGFKIFTDPRLGRIEDRDVSFFMEILFLLKTFFFVYLGLSIEFSDGRLLGWAAIFCGILYTARLVIVKVVTRADAADWEDRSVASVLVAKGLVSAVLAGIPMAAGIAGADKLQEFTYMVVLCSITLTAVLIPLSDRAPLASFYRRFYDRPRVQGAATV